MSRNVEITIEVIGERAVKLQTVRGILRELPLCHNRIQLKSMSTCIASSDEPDEWCNNCKQQNLWWLRRAEASKSLSSGIVSLKKRIERSSAKRYDGEWSTNDLP